MRDGQFERMLGRIYEAVAPMYKQLHAYVRRKLVEHYGEDKVDIKGTIPAHLLGEEVDLSRLMGCLPRWRRMK